MHVKAILLAGSALTLSASALTAEEKLRAEVFTSWTSGGETRAVEVLKNAFESRGGEWETASIAGFENANAAFQNRLVAGDPPTVFKAVLGKDVEEIVQSGMANPVQDVAEAGKWAEVMAPGVYNSIAYDGVIYQAPVAVHGESWMFYSRAAFEKAGIREAPESWDAFFADMDKLKAAGLTPIAWGGQAWQETKVFNMILQSQLGNDAFLKAYAEGDEAVLTSERVMRALEIFGRLRDYVDAGSPGRNWNDATNMLIQNTAGVQFMGDWAKGEFFGAGQQVDVDFGCALAPEVNGMIFVADGFLMMKTGDAGQDAAQKLMAEVVTDPAVQVAFAAAKGSIPVRTDVDASGLDACVRKSITLMEEGKFVPEHAITISPNKVGELTDFVGEYWADPSADPAEAAAIFADILRK
jgi:glucose/mannose transport system substrate-binding protein